MSGVIYRCNAHCLGNWCDGGGTINWLYGNLFFPFERYLIWYFSDYWIKCPKSRNSVSSWRSSTQGHNFSRTVTQRMNGEWIVAKARYIYWSNYGRIEWIVLVKWIAVLKIIELLVVYRIHYWQTYFSCINWILYLTYLFHQSYWFVLYF